MKRRGLFVTFVTTVALLVPATAGLAGGSKEPIKIGVLSTLSGPVGEVGQDAVRGAQLAADQVNESGGLLGGRDVELIVADEQADAALAVQGATRLIQEDKVSVVLGPISAGPAIAVSQVATRSRVPQVAFNAGARELTQSGSAFVFRTYIVVQDSHSVLAQYAVKELGYKKIAWLGWNETAGKAALEGFEEGLKKAKGTLTGKEEVALLNFNLSAEIGRLRATNPDALMLAGPLPLGGNIVRQVRAAGWNVPLLGYAGWYNTTFGTFTGAASDGMVMSSAYHPEIVTAKVGKKFLKDFQAAHGRLPRDGEAVGYDAMLAAAAAIKKAKSSDPVKIAAALHKITVEGTKSTLKWTKTGDLNPKPPVVIVEVKGGVQELIEKNP